jgi:hypothetical protein
VELTWRYLLFIILDKGKEEEAVLLYIIYDFRKERTQKVRTQFQDEEIFK